MSQKSWENRKGSAWNNIRKIVYLIAALVVTWFVLEWTMGGK